MAVKKMRSRTPSQGHTISDSYDDITSSRPEPSLVVSQQRSVGRNAVCKISIREIAGGHKQMVHLMDL